MAENVFETADIGLATYLDYWVWWIECKKHERGYCTFFLKYEDKGQIEKLVKDYKDEKDGTPAKAFRRHYKQVATIIDRTMKPR